MVLTQLINAKRPEKVFVTLWTLSKQNYRMRCLLGGGEGEIERSVKQTMQLQFEVKKLYARFQK